MEKRIAIFFPVIFLLFLLPFTFQSCQKIEYNGYETIELMKSVSKDKIMETEEVNSQETAEDLLNKSETALTFLSLLLLIPVIAIFVASVNNLSVNAYSSIILSLGGILSLLAIRNALTNIAISSVRIFEMRSGYPTLMIFFILYLLFAIYLLGKKYLMNAS